VNGYEEEHTTPKTILMHELPHARHYHFKETGSNRASEEAAAVRAENQLRQEQDPPLPKRDCYVLKGKKKVVNPCQKDLDDSDRVSCNCPPEE
jgi:hypothetical protein